MPDQPGSAPAGAQPVAVFARAGFFTVFDNALLDHVLPTLSPNAWKVLCLVVRRTVGFQRETTPQDGRGLSLPRIRKATGIRSKTTVRKALDELIDPARPGGPLVLAEPGEDGTAESFAYSINREAIVFVPLSPSVDNPWTGGSENDPPRSDSVRGRGSENDPLENKPSEDRRRRKGERKKSNVDNRPRSEPDRPALDQVKEFFHGADDLAEESDAGPWVSPAQAEASAIEFWETHEATGWIWNGKPVRSWRTLATGWIRRRPVPKTKAGKPKPVQDDDPTRYWREQEAQDALRAHPAYTGQALSDVFEPVWKPAAWGALPRFRVRSDSPIVFLDGGAVGSAA